MSSRSTLDASKSSTTPYPTRTPLDYERVFIKILEDRILSLGKQLDQKQRTIEKLMETLKTVAKIECTTEKPQECRIEKSSQSEKDFMSSKENGTMKNKTSIVYEDTESEVSSQIKAQREKQGKMKKSKKKKNATKGLSQAITQSTIEVEEQKNGEIEDNKAKSEISMGKKDNKDAKNQSSPRPRSTGLNKQRKTIVIGDSMVKNVKAWKLKEQCEKNEHIYVYDFPGTTTKDMASYSQPLVEKKPDTIIIHCGTKDLNKTGKSEVMIASEIVALAKSIGSNGIDVCVSGLITRGDIL